MPKYNVRLALTCAYETEVEATDEKDAMKVAFKEVEVQNSRINEMYDLDYDPFDSEIEEIEEEEEEEEE